MTDAQRVSTLREALGAAAQNNHDEGGHGGYGGPKTYRDCADAWCRKAVADLEAAGPSPEPHVHVVEYPSACTGCEHLAAAFVAAAPDWMLASRIAAKEGSPK